ncbi:MAG: hypothetical protein QGG39_05785 [Candidatus Poribacteria bacterium]|nr:hypothetical protein [Candidatus Poribacteria bacterium]
MELLHKSIIGAKFKIVDREKVDDAIRSILQFVSLSVDREVSPLP